MPQHPITGNAGSPRRRRHMDAPRRVGRGVRGARRRAEDVGAAR